METYMNPAIASVVFSALAILISLFGTLRMTKKSAQMQEWNYRQKVGEELGALSNLLTQNQLLTQRVQQRTELVEREAKRILIRAPGNSVITSFLQEATVSKAEADNQMKSDMELRKRMDQIWQLDQSSPNQLAALQQMKASVQKQLLRMQDLEPTVEGKYRNFLASAANVP